MDDELRLRALVKNSSLRPGRFRIQARADEQTIRNIKRGILFNMAFWSGQAVLAFRLLTKTVADLDPDGVLEIVVADTDESPALYELPEWLGMVHGMGETAWILNGGFVSTAVQGPDPQSFALNTQALLAMPTESA